MGRARLILFVVIATVLLAFPFMAVLRSAEGDTLIHRWRRAVTAQDLPQVWFDGRIGAIPAEVCDVRKETRDGKYWKTEWLSATPLAIDGGPQPYTIFLHDLDVEMDQPASKAQVALLYGGTAPAYREDVQYRATCAKGGDRVRIDACLGASGDTLVACAPRGEVGELRPMRNLLAERAWRVRSASYIVWLFAIPTALAFIVLGRASFRAGHRLEPLFRGRNPELTAVLASVPAIGVAAFAVAHGTSPLTATFVVVPIFPLVFFVLRSARFHDVIRDLRTPPAGKIVVEGRVGSESPLGLSVLGGRKVAVSFVAVAKVVADQFEPVGEVNDVGRLDVTTGETTIALKLDDAMLELERDAMAVMRAVRVPTEIRDALALENDASYRIREHALDRGDPVCVLVEGSALLDDSREGAGGGDPYRSAPRVTKANVVVPRRARPAIFEGSRADAIARLDAKALRMDLAAAFFGGVALAGAGWSMAVALWYV